MSGLIEGLPDAVALRCLARVPFYLYPRLELVSHSWREAIRSTELFRAREEVKSTEEFICVCAYDPNNVWQLYDPQHDLWITLPDLPSNVQHLAHFGVVSAAGKLFVFGGGSAAVDPLTGDHDGSFATDEVWSYNPITRQWSLCAPMIVPRSMFACCELDGKIIVAGGFTTCRKSILKAEIYDPEKNTWLSIPDLHHTHECHTHESTCTGVVIDGKVHILQKARSTVQVLENIKVGWTVHNYSWLQSMSPMMTLVKEKLYIMSHGQIYKQERDSCKFIVSASSEFRRKIGSAIIGLGDDIYIIGGVIGPDRLNWDIKSTSDVDVLTLGNERSVWRQVAPMTRCRGTVLGCTQLRV